MQKPEWQKTTYSLSDLIDRARRTRHFNSVFGWLKSQGYIPENVESAKIAQVKVVNPEAVEAGYLASAAYEWDSWGPSSPLEFLRAIELESDGNAGRDIITETLQALGAAIESEEEVTYKVHLP